MYLITNRALNKEEKGLDIFGKTPNPAGPNELRMVRVTKNNSTWVTKEIKDNLTPATLKALKKNINWTSIFPNRGMEVLRWPASFLSRRASKRSRYYFLSTDITMTSRMS